MTIQITSRADVQAVRIRVAAGACNMNVAELHRALADKGYEVSYEKLRRAWDGQRKTDLDYTIIKWIAEVTGADPAFVVGDNDAPFPDLLKGVYLSSAPTLAIA